MIAPPFKKKQQLVDNAAGHVWGNTAVATMGAFFLGVYCVQSNPPLVVR